MTTCAEEYNYLIGMTYEQAVEAVKGTPVNNIRVVCIDGKYQLVTADFRRDRLDVVMERDRIVGIAS